MLNLFLVALLISAGVYAYKNKEVFQQTTGEN